MVGLAAGVALRTGDYLNTTGSKGSSSGNSSGSKGCIPGSIHSGGRLGAPTFIENMDYDSTFTTEVCDTRYTTTNIYDVCFNANITTNPSQPEEANLTYMKKAPAILNRPYCVGLIAPERLQHLVENGQFLKGYYYS